MQGKPEIEGAALAQIVRRYPGLGAYRGILRNGMSENSAACVFESDAGRFFAKRYDPRQVDAHSLLWEHGIVLQLRAAHYPTPMIHANNRGDTITWLAESPYAIFSLASGEDRYGDRPVFEPFDDREEARAAGKWLARFHLVTQEGPLPAPRPMKGLLAQYRIWFAADVREALRALVAGLPGLEAYVTQRPEWPALLDEVAALAPAIAESSEEWPVGVIHGDWIKRNLFWQGPEVSDVLDFGMWNVGPWVFDLALALLPVGFNWPEVLAGRSEPNHRDLMSFLAGYQTERPLLLAEREALPLVMETARVEFYLGAVADALQRGDQSRAALFWDLLVATRQYFRQHPGWREVLV
ncbi:MAG: phosphotransferase [Candidatus Sericytochromatia bacterium]|nr:phosphotransferase [Candidatus Sericytochromatia bacterium]